MSIGSRLKEERERLGLSQPAFGELGGVQKRAQINYESGERFPDAAYLAAIAKAGADVRYIVTGDREGPAPELLSADEKELLSLFRAAPLAVKAAAIGALQGAAAIPAKKSRKEMVFHGDVGQVVNADTANQQGLSISMGGKKK